VIRDAGKVYDTRFVGVEGSSSPWGRERGELSSVFREAYFRKKKGKRVGMEKDRLRGEKKMVSVESERIRADRDTGGERILENEGSVLGKNIGSKRRVCWICGGELLERDRFERGGGLSGGPRKTTKKEIWYQEGIRPDP